MPKKLKPLPQFTSEDEEREFWAAQDSTEYLDWSKAIKNPSFPNLKRTEGLVHLILPNTLRKKLEQLAESRNIPIELLAERFIREGMLRESPGQ
jgi:hypothetical protein